VTPPPRDGPEREAREHIDHALAAAGWVVQDRADMNLAAGQGVAVREFPMASGHGFADYLLFVDGAPVGALEAKKVGHTLSGVEVQARKYAQGLPPELSAPISPLPFLYISTGARTRFTNRLDPRPRSRLIFSFHRPETLAEWLAAEPLPAGAAAPDATASRGDPTASRAAERAPAGGQYGTKPSTLRGRLQHLPPPDTTGLWANQAQALINVEKSLAEDRPRALVQMATGSGKTRTAISIIYRLIKYGGARRVLFLVDRDNLGKQAEDDFCAYRTPDGNRKFDELYNVQRLTQNKIGSSAKVVITTIQRLYSMLQGTPDFEPENEAASLFEAEPDAEPGAEPNAEPNAAPDAPADIKKDPLPVVYNDTIPIEHFDVIFIDECHRSIYTLWRQVLEYFDAYLIGLTATPAMHTFGFFNQNLVMEYNHEKAVADGVNCDFEVYRIRTRITEQGATIEAAPGVSVGYRSRQTRQLRWEQADEDITYDATDINRKVVAKDQIRLIVRTFRDKVRTEIFPGRKEVPKTIIFAVDDSHAEDIVELIREEFAEGNDFCQKITYRTTGKDPKQLIQDFRIGYYPRIAVTVDMIATGTDIKPVEIVMFMRAVRSRLFFEQMKGRGVRIVDETTHENVNPGVKRKTHFVLVDCVGVCETQMSESQPLERKRTVSFKKLLELVAAGSTDPDVLSSLASRLARLDKQTTPDERKRIKDTSEGHSLTDLTHNILRALDPDEQESRAREQLGLPADATPTDEQRAQAAITIAKEATAPLATKPPLRILLQELKQQHEQIIDEVTQDSLEEAGFSQDAKDRAQRLVASFEQFLADNKDEIDALQFFYSQPYATRLRFSDIQALAEAIGAPPRSWTPEALWRAYQTLATDRVRGASGQRLLTDIVSLVRFALHQDPELVPYRQKVDQRYQTWLTQQQNQGRQFTPDQMRWIEMIRDHIANSLEIDLDDFDMTPFSQKGGLGKATQLFGKDLPTILTSLNKALAA